MSKPIELFTSAFCGYCVRAKALLDHKGVDYEEIRVDLEPERRREMMERSQRRTVPQVFVHGEAIGGSDELHQLEASGKLDELLARDQA